MDEWEDRLKVSTPSYLCEEDVFSTRGVDVLSDFDTTEWSTH